MNDDPVQTYQQGEMLLMTTCQLQVTITCYCPKSVDKLEREKKGTEEG